LENKKIIGLEFTEINPLLDRDKPMELVAAGLIHQIFC
jgi:arginase family enzyme